MEKEMVFLGVLERQSKEKGNRYHLARFDIQNAGEVKFYLSNDDVKQEVSVLKPYSNVIATLGIKAYNGRAEVDLVGVRPAN